MAIHYTTSTTNIFLLRGAYIYTHVCIQMIYICIHADKLLKLAMIYVCFQDNNDNFWLQLSKDNGKTPLEIVHIISTFRTQPMKENELLSKGLYKDFSFVLRERNIQHDDTFLILYLKSFWCHLGDSQSVLTTVRLRRRCDSCGFSHENTSHCRHNNILFILF